MKKAVLILAFLFASELGCAQQLFYFKDAFATAIADTVYYPVHGIFKIDESSFGAYKNLQLWVYDAREKEIYYVIQSISTKEELSYLAEKMIDKTYAMLMMHHGHVIAEKCEEKDVVQIW
ncbi:MAG TPA: hypothetical protein VNB90_14045 [Cytophagaceae bacterium]|nr:hypothetical protein [Cytophagaceae bacterium]